MIHHFAELPVNPCLVAATELTYDENPTATLLTAATQRGYIYDTITQKYTSRAYPPISLTYSAAVIDEKVHYLDKAAVGIPNTEKPLLAEDTAVLRDLRELERRKRSTVPIVKAGTPIPRTSPKFAALQGTAVATWGKREHGSARIASRFPRAPSFRDKSTTQRRAPHRRDKGHARLLHRSRLRRALGFAKEKI